MSAEQRRIVLASRSSQLAQIQTNIVLDTLKGAFPERAFGTAFMSTQGDKDLSRALYLLGGKSLWTKELEVALLKGEVDMLVHSLKDVPTAMPEGCALGAILEREYGEDSLVVKKGYTVDGRTVHTLDDLPAGAVIGTSSVRRVAQLKRRLKTQGQESRGRKHHAHVDVRRTMRASLQTGGVPVDLRYKPVRPRRPASKRH